MNQIFEQLKEEAMYAQRSFSTNLLCQTYGRAEMALQLEAITYEEFEEINRMTVCFMNTDQEYIRHEGREFRWEHRSSDIDVYLNADFKGNPVGGTLHFTDATELMDHIESQMEFGRTVTIGSKDIFREEAVTPW